MEAFDEAVRLRTAHLRRAVFDLLELEEQLVGVTVLTAEELTPVVAEAARTFTACSAKTAATRLFRIWTAVTGSFEVTAVRTRSG